MTWRRKSADKFDESKHPRADDGKFGSGGGGGGSGKLEPKEGNSTSSSPGDTAGAGKASPKLLMTKAGDIHSIKVGNDTVTPGDDSFHEQMAKVIHGGLEKAFESGTGKIGQAMEKGDKAGAMTEAESVEKSLGSIMGKWQDWAAKAQEAQWGKGLSQGDEDAFYAASSDMRAELAAAIGAVKEAISSGDADAVTDASSALDDVIQALPEDMADAANAHSASIESQRAEQEDTANASVGDLNQMDDDEAVDEATQYNADAADEGSPFRVHQDDNGEWAVSHVDDLEQVDYPGKEVGGKSYRWSSKSAESSGKWITLSPSGTHVHLDESGGIDKGPGKLAGKPADKLSGSHSAGSGKEHGKFSTSAEPAKPKPGAESGKLAAKEEIPGVQATLDASPGSLPSSQPKPTLKDPNSKQAKAAAKVHAALPSPKEWLDIVQNKFNKPGTFEHTVAHGDMGGICDRVSPLLKDYLAKKGIKAKMVMGMYNTPNDPKFKEHDHAWLETEDGVVIDGSQCQFKEGVLPGMITVSENAKAYQEGAAQDKPSMKEAPKPKTTTTSKEAPKKEAQKLVSKPAEKPTAAESQVASEGRVAVTDAKQVGSKITNAIKAADRTGDGDAPTDNLYHELKRTIAPTMTPEQYKGMLVHLSDSGQLQLKILNEVRRAGPEWQQLAIQEGDNFYGYALPGRNATPESIGVAAKEYLDKNSIETSEEDYNPYGPGYDKHGRKLT